MKDLTKSAAAGGALFLMMGAAASPAMADNVYVEGNAHYGTFAFVDDGDMFRVCDTKADGAGVRGYVYYDPWVGSGYWKTFSNGKNYIEDGGDAGCNKAGLNIGNDGDYYMSICWNGAPGGGSCVQSEWFNE